MYDAREKAIRDHQWALSASRNEGKSEGKFEGKIEGKIEEKIAHIQALQSIIHAVVTPESELMAMNLRELQSLASELQEKIRSRLSHLPT